ncbi:MAG: hypothetical protein LBP62_07255 [Clostridiales bacterium]|nr:hypothetical protein [Clostridiales bacterium]
MIPPAEGNSGKLEKCGKMRFKRGIEDSKESSPHPLPLPRRGIYKDINFFTLACFFSV